MRLAGPCLCLVLLVACGEANVCQRACEQMKSCGKARLADLDCDDPKYASACELIRQALAVDCSQATDQACTGDYRAESERTVKCDLDPNTCVCPRNVCLDACLEQKDCAEVSLNSLDCTKNAATCDELKQMVNKDCYAFSDANCTGALKIAAEAIDSCYLNHITCMCLN